MIYAIPFLLALVFVSIACLPSSFAFHVEMRSNNSTIMGNQTSQPYIAAPPIGSNLFPESDQLTLQEEMILREMFNPDKTREEIQNEMILEELRELNR